jgi:leucyl-tRNA synthetase
MGYGTGAVMCVSAHDERDWEFAKKFDLPITQVISKDKKEDNLTEPYIEAGYLINSDKYDELESQLAKKKIIDDLQKDGLAQSATNYRLRDWLISRQRYWGAPIPIIYCDKCGEMAVPEKDLPVKLPDDIEFKPHGDSPLKSSPEFMDTTCPSCGEKATRETDTMDTFVDSSWYYLRYCDHKNDNEFASQDKINYWMPVDTYVGGIEHAVLHLLYARFIAKALKKIGAVNFNDSGEPFSKLFNIGMIYLHGAKMSKSKGNVVSPDDLIEKYGTDALRGYELFIGPAEQDSEWQVQGITGVRRFLDKAWSWYDQEFKESETKDSEIEKTIKTITVEIESIHPNTAISHLMTLFNYLKTNKDVSKDYAQKITVLLAPFFPHLAEEIWQKLGNNESVFKSIWPKFNEKEIHDETINIPIQINGKVKDIIEVNKNWSQDEIEKVAKARTNIDIVIGNKTIKKTIYVAGKVINFVVE